MLIQPIFNKASASSKWIQDSDNDFNNGTMDNLTIVQTGSSKVLELKRDANWLQKYPEYTPGQKSFHGMASIYGTDNVLVFGYPDNFTWIYDLSEDNWMKRSHINAPGIRNSFGMTGLWNDDKIVLYGGGYGGLHLNDTWVYDFSDDTWIRKSNGPNNRTNYNLINIYGTHKVLLFGGLYFDGNDLHNINDTWIYDFDQDEWKEIHPSISPTGRNGYAMAPIFGTDDIILFGGYDGNFKNDTWLFDLSNNTWIQKYPRITPSKRVGHSLSFIYNRNEVTLYGGKDSNNRFSDTWTYDFNKNIWLNETQTIKPNPRAGHTMVTIYQTSKLVLFGGQYWDNGYKDYDETWVLNVSGYIYNGTYISKEFDTSSKSKFKTISWNASVIENTNIEIQLRTSNEKSDLINKDFIGPDGTLTTYYSSSPSNIWSGHNRNRWIQCEVLLTSNNKDKTPILQNITIIYDLLPIVIPKEPINESFLENKKPVFKWFFNDDDSKEQTAFQIIIANDIEFNDIRYDSLNQKSKEQQWQFPEGTDFSELSDEIWYWKIRGMDNDGGWSEYSEPFIFTIDTKLPNSLINIPKNNDYYYDLDIISGIADDKIDGSGINKVEITIKRLADDHYWDGMNWLSSETWLLTQGTSEWIYNSNSVYWIPEMKYIVKSRATDNASNIEIPNAQIEFSIDRGRPSSIIEIPLNNSNINNLNIISGKSYDKKGSGINRTEITIKCNSNNFYWDGDRWDFRERWLTTSGTSNWFYNSSNIDWLTDTEYTITSKAFDNASNQELSKPGLVLMYDNRPPENLSIKINNADYFSNSTDVILTIEGKDTGSGISLMSFSNDNLIWSNWEQYNISRTFELTSNDGEKKIYFKLQDNANNIADSVFYSIILDISPPRDLSIKINNESKETNLTKVNLILQAFDDTSGLDMMSFSNDGEIWTSWEPFKFNKSFILPPNDGEKTIYFRVKDKVNNIANPVFSTILLNTTQPQNNQVNEKENNKLYLTFIIIITSIAIILIILILIVFFYFRKKNYNNKILKENSIKTTSITRIQTNQYPQIQTQYIDQNPQYKCEGCNATILDQNKCPYCGWTRQF